MPRPHRGPLITILAAGLILATVTAPRVKAGLLVTANDDAYTVRHDHALTVASPGVLANDSGVGMTAAKLTNPAHGTVILNANGSFTYQPSAGYVGSDAFTYEARFLNLGILLTDPATVTITVTNATPVATNDTYAATTGVQLTVPAPGVLSNDTDADGDALTATKVTDSGSGSVNLASNGSFTFTSGGSFTGARTFTYRVSDGIAWSNTATVTINVSAPAPTPPPTPAPTPAPTPTPTPNAAPTATLLPTLPPLPTLVPTLPPLPTLPPTPSGSTRPDPSAGSTPSGSSTPGQTPSPSTSTDAGPATDSGSGDGSGGAPVGAGTIGAGTVGADSSIGPDGAGGSEGDPVGFAVGRADPAEIEGLGDLGVVGIGSLVEWAVPALVLSVPGLLLVLAVLAQAVGGVLWLPVARRWLGGFGIRRRAAEPR